MKKIGEIKEEFAAASEGQWADLCAGYAEDQRSGVQKIVSQYQKKLENLEKEKLRMEQMMQYEHEYEHLGYLCGIDEVGRGPLAGPVVACAVIGVVFCVQFLSWLIDWSSQNRRLREYMRPIDELAMTAEKLSVQGIDEERIQNLEEAIDQLTASENNISTGDSDLKGIENAINNLLKRLQASYREQTRFVDDASHELRTPIAVIQGYASMLERWGMDDRATLEEAVHAISEESAHMKELVDQLLFLARGDGGRQQFHPEPIQAEELMKEICEESEMIDHRHQYTLVQKWNGYIQADDYYKIIFNICGNDQTGNPDTGGQCCQIYPGRRENHPAPGVMRGWQSRSWCTG